MFTKTLETPVKEYESSVGTVPDFLKTFIPPCCGICKFWLREVKHPAYPDFARCVYPSIAGGEMVSCFFYNGDTNFGHGLLYTTEQFWCKACESNT